MAMANEGAAVALAARTADEIESAADQVRTNGGAALAVQTDVTQQNQVDALFAQVTEHLGQVDILVNNAAIGSRMVGNLWETEPDDWLEMFDVNVIGMVRCTRAVLPSMIERRGGKIIVVGSIAGRSESWALRNHELLGYALSKAAANRFSEVLAAQVKGYGINVNCIGVGAHTTISEPGLRERARRTGQPPPPAIEQIPEDRRIRP
ncbi:MAG: SDR family oxidoreductase, partial [Phycisphaeraceae bacterium]|nr:SDR family oxidoreductase [Phycisphaeraceae bacterium]